MKETLILIFKGFVIGIGKIIPGVSGSLIAVSLGLYEKTIEIISNIFSDFKNNVIYLGTLGVGILVSIILGSNIISYFLSNYYMMTMFLFIGLILSSILDINYKIEKKDYFIVVIVALISFLLFNLKTTNQYDFNNLLSLFIIGFIDAFTMIVPGISGTAIFMLLGCYDELLYIFKNMISLIFIKPSSLIMLGLGVMVGIIVTSKLMNYLFKNKSNIVYSIILGFSISTVLYIFIQILNTNYEITEFLISMLFLIFGFIITTVSSHKIN